MSNVSAKPDILISSGEFFDFVHPENNVFDIEDIAFALSRLCRFTGHLRRDLDDSILSVAQHCVLVSRLVPPSKARVALLHDAAEAFLGDVAKPLKNLLPDYQAIERRVEAEVLSRFGLALPYPEVVHQADQAALAIERFWCMPAARTSAWQLVTIPEQWRDIAAQELVPLGPRAARLAFLARYAELSGN